MTVFELLDKGEKYVGPTKGGSMLPMLKEGRDSVVICPKTERLKPLDVALYTLGDNYVLHRVIKVVPEGYLIRGDNCYFDELVKESQVIGVLTEYFKKNERINLSDKKYLRYAKRRVKNYRVRLFFHRLKIGTKNLIKKIIGKR